LTPLGRLASSTAYSLDPGRFALFSEVKNLDYALIAIGERISGNASIEELGFCSLSDTPDRHVLGMNLNIIQHPNGLPKMVAFRESVLTARTERTVLYDTDTDVGSSGSPVFNDTWDVIALHHWGEPFLEKIDEDGNEIPLTVNEGVRISAIYQDLRRQLPALTPERRELLEAALAALDSGGTASGGRRLGPPRPNASEALAATNGSSNQGVQMPEQDSLRFTLPPIEVSLRFAPQVAVVSSGPSAVGEGIALEVAARKLRRRGPEAIQLDEDYSSRSGYDPEFIPGLAVPLPTPNEKLAKQIAPLRAGEPDAAAGELKYQNFSIKMNKAKRLAMFTATNIDGEAYLRVDRGTGKVVYGPEGEKWFKDPRMSESFWTGQDFYSEWSSYFDRGHLTRRTDPTWGSEEEAERANADTYHFTNCSPQHFRFNETTKFWQGAEQYILENGVLAAETRRRIVVIQGPIFDSKIDQYADDLQIPSSFFKVIVWRSTAGAKTVGLIVDQRELLDEARVNLGPPKKAKFVNVGQWRVAISQIEKRTGLTFSQQVKDADTIGSATQPVVGAEAAIPLASFEDLLR
jgi:endonuclease G